MYWHSVRAGLSEYVASSYSLDAMYEELKSSDTSFFSISGIHGRPYVEWNGVQVPGKRGYCVHGTEQFPTWHRPYVALLEQQIQQHAIEIAGQYIVDQAGWQLAALSLRQPYWDWADPAGIFPSALEQVLSQDEVSILLPPQAQEGMFRNPFYWYPFKAGETDALSAPTSVDLGPFSIWQKTLRHPTTQEADATSDISSLKETLKSREAGIRYDTERLFSLNTWKEFSVENETTNSLEAIHGEIHDLVGRLVRGGHMSKVAFAAFDPIFYMHHAQVDRLVAMWYAQHQLWAPNADHPPFRKFQDAFWASEDIRQTEVFNYRYLPGNVSGLSEGDSIREWTVRIRCKKFEVGGNFSVLLFLKDSEDPEDPEVPDVPPLPANPNKWFFAPTFIGAFDTFVNDTPEECTNCQEHAQDIISGFVHINESITKNRYAGTLDPVVVEPFLTKRLNWRVLKADGTEVDISSSFTSLVVDVMATPLTRRVGVPFPEAGEPVIFDGITRGKPGGSALVLSQ
jgi:tyrosinase